MRSFVWGLVLSGCADGDVSFVTYNAGLAVGFVPGASTRGADTAAAVAALDADVVCLQEVWLPADVAAFEAAAASAFPHVYFPTPAPVVDIEPACDDGELDTLLQCFEDNCVDVCIDDQAECLLSSCALPFAGLPPDCGGCVQANVGGTPDTVREACESSTVRYAYGGSFGTGLLSKFPLIDPGHEDFESTTNRRGVIHAVLDAPGADLDVWCTHLAADLSPIPYTGASASWAAEQADQIVGSMEIIDAAAFDGDVVWLGDFNTGPDIPGGEEELPENYDLIVGAGFVDPYVEQDQPCTFCADNPIVTSTGDSRTIDHVFVRGSDAGFGASRVMDQPVEIDHCDTPGPGAHSDHYGVRVTLDR
jgi:endonuclease/exonuclease/phosphatase family metal-dependent hydrolase